MAYAQSACYANPAAFAFALHIGGRGGLRRAAEGPGGAVPLGSSGAGVVVLRMRMRGTCRAMVHRQTSELPQALNIKLPHLTLRGLAPVPVGTLHEACTAAPRPAHCFAIRQLQTAESPR